jgi:predicted dehydrogenase
VATRSDEWQRPTSDRAPDEAYQASYTAAQSHFVKCLREGRSPETVASDNYKTLAVTMAAYASAAHKRVIVMEDWDGV